jgi:hypothetical protein
MHSIKESVTKSTPRYDMHGLTRESKLKWVIKNVTRLGNHHYKYQTYPNSKVNDGIFKMTSEPDKEITIALLSDWASNTFESHNIAQLAGENDYSIHLGDTYYVGNSKEIADNFNDSFGAPWPYGRLGSFAMLGNHEMYSSGRYYFTQLLPYMGVYKGEHTNQQEASFFCLENDHWKIIGLDTGYNSLKGFWGIKANSKLKLHEWQMNWLRETVLENNDKKGIILLSHHQCFSAFRDDDHIEPLKQLAPLLGSDRTVLWFWGHEHRLALYGCNQLPNGSKLFGRCVGTGGMPVELGKKPGSLTFSDPVNRSLVIYDERERKVIGKNNSIRLGHNGYAILKLRNNMLTIEYYDDNNNNLQGVQRLILEENWTIDINTGKLEGTGIKDHTQTSNNRLTLFSDNISKAIKIT